MQFHMPDFTHIPHPHLERRREMFLKAKEEANGFNSKLAVHITNVVLVAWFAQTFLQLVLLSIIMVGQKVAAAKSDKQLEQTYYDAEALLQVSDDMHKLVKQNVELTGQMNELLRQNTELTEQINKLVCKSGDA